MTSRAVISSKSPNGLVVKAAKKLGGEVLNKAIANDKGELNGAELKVTNNMCNQLGVSTQSLGSAMGLLSIHNPNLTSNQKMAALKLVQEAQAMVVLDRTVQKEDVHRKFVLKKNPVSITP